MNVPRLPGSPIPTFTPVLSPVLGGVGRMSESLLTAARRGGIVAAVVTASSLGLLGGGGEVMYPRAARSQRDGDLTAA